MIVPGFSLSLTENVRRKLGQYHISEDDVRAVIDSAESSARFVTDTASGFRFAHKEIGEITLWVKYRSIGKTDYILESVYFHRIKIIETAH